MVGLRLTLEEYEALSEMARAEDRSLSSMARQLVQRGMASVKEAQSLAAVRPAA